MYNEKFKQEFMDNLDLKEATIVRYQALFNRSATYEKDLGVDLYDFDLDEIKFFYHYLNSRSINTISNNHSLIIRYVDYAIERGVRQSNINVYRNFQYKHLAEMVADYKQQYITLEELNEILDLFVNYYDIAMYRGIFEGIGGRQYSELANLKRDDLYEKDGRYYAVLHDDKSLEPTKRTIEISETLYNELLKVYHADFYRSKNGESEHMDEIEIREGEHIFRLANAGRGSHSSVNKINMQTVYRRKEQMSEMTDGKVDRIDILVTSGMLHMANEIFERNGKLTIDDCLDILEHYNKGISSEVRAVAVARAKRIFSKGLNDLYDIQISD